MSDERVDLEFVRLMVASKHVATDWNMARLKEACLALIAEVEQSREREQDRSDEALCASEYESLCADAKRVFGDGEATP